MSTDELIQKATEAIHASDFQAAIAFSDQAIAMNPRLAEAYVLKGIALAQTSRTDEASRALSTAVELEPANPKGLYNLAAHYYQIGRKDEAQDLIQRSLVIDPSHKLSQELSTRLNQELSYHPTFNYIETKQQTFTERKTSVEPHTIPLVAKMGSTWVAIGWFSCLLAILLNVITLLNQTPPPQGATLDEALKHSMAQSTPLLQLVGYIYWINMIAFYTWIIADITDRRGSWWWLLPATVLCCLPFVYGPIYILVGRSFKQAEPPV